MTEKHGKPDGTRAIAHGAADAPDGSDEGSEFLADLARAMQATVGAQRRRITEAADERHKAHVNAIRERETAQAAEFRDLSERDVKGIEGWATAEIERIRLERERRIAARKTELERRLEQHHTSVESEIAAVEAAVGAYHEEVDRFFARLDVESDPIAIAQAAANLPPFPTFEGVSSGGVSNASTNGSGPIAVARAKDDVKDAEPESVQSSDQPDGQSPREGEASDDETAIAAEDVDSPVAVAAAEPIAVDDVAAPSGSEGQMVGVAETTVAKAAARPGEPDADASAEEDPESDPLVGVGQKVTPRSSGAVIHSVPSLRPIGSWLRRSENSDNPD